MRQCLIIILILMLGAASAAKITVGPENADYAKIQQAIDNATNGDVIEVHSGTYHENVYVFKPVALLGVDTGQGMPLVDASGAGSVITLASNGTTVEGFNVTDSGHCGCQIPESWSTPATIPSLATRSTEINMVFTSNRE